MILKPSMRPDLPTGTVTFLFTDVEGSTRLLHEIGPESYAAALAQHRRSLREAFAAEGGVEVDRPPHSRRAARAAEPSRQPPDTRPQRSWSFEGEG
jgi:hypothetical protein